MSTMNPSTLTDHGTTLQETITRVAGTLRTPVRAAAFWAAIVLPFTYLPLLAGGLTGAESSTFAALIVANALALLAGHNHGR